MAPTALEVIDLLPYQALRAEAGRHGIRRNLSAVNLRTALRELLSNAPNLANIPPQWFVGASAPLPDTGRTPVSGPVSAGRPIATNARTNAVPAPRNLPGRWSSRLHQVQRLSAALSGHPAPPSPAGSPSRGPPLQTISPSNFAPSLPHHAPLGLPSVGPSSSERSPSSPAANVLSGLAPPSQPSPSHRPRSVHTANDDSDMASPSAEPLVGPVPSPAPPPAGHTTSPTQQPSTAQDFENALRHEAHRLGHSRSLDSETLSSLAELNREILAELILQPGRTSIDRIRDAFRQVSCRPTPTPAGSPPLAAEVHHQLGGITPPLSPGLSSRTELQNGPRDDLTGSLSSHRAPSEEFHQVAPSDLSHDVDMGQPLLDNGLESRSDSSNVAGRMSSQRPSSPSSQGSLLPPEATQQRNLITSSTPSNPFTSPVYPGLTPPEFRPAFSSALSHGVNAAISDPSSDPTVPPVNPAPNLQGPPVIRSTPDEPQIPTHHSSDSLRNDSSGESLRPPPAAQRRFRTTQESETASSVNTTSPLTQRQLNSSQGGVVPTEPTSRQYFFASLAPAPDHLRMALSSPSTDDSLGDLLDRRRNSVVSSSSEEADLVILTSPQNSTSNPQEPISPHRPPSPTVEPRIMSLPPSSPSSHASTPRDSSGYQPDSSDEGQGTDPSSHRSASSPDPHRDS